MMTGTRFLALFVAACALVASALVAIPIDSATVPTASIPYPETYRLTANSAGAASSWRAAPTEESEAAVPRLWLGNPIAR